MGFSQRSLGPLQVAGCFLKRLPHDKRRQVGIHCQLYVKSGLCQWLLGLRFTCRLVPHTRRSILSSAAMSLRLHNLAGPTPRPAAPLASVGKWSVSSGQASDATACSPSWATCCCCGAPWRNSHAGPFMQNPDSLFCMYNGEHARGSVARAIIIELMTSISQTSWAPTFKSGSTRPKTCQNLHGTELTSWANQQSAR